MLRVSLQGDIHEESLQALQGDIHVEQCSKLTKRHLLNNSYRTTIEITVGIE